MTEKWGYPDLDAADFAMDKFFDALAVITEARGKIWDAKRAGTATPEDDVRMEELRAAQWIANHARDRRRTAKTDIARPCSAADHELRQR
jgi:hypothetical protein